MIVNLRIMLEIFYFEKIYDDHNNYKPHFLLFTICSTFTINIIFFKFQN